jgi:hypothetical protein
MARARSAIAGSELKSALALREAGCASVDCRLVSLAEGHVARARRRDSQGRREGPVSFPVKLTVRWETVPLIDAGLEFLYSLNCFERRDVARPLRRVPGRLSPALRT